MTAYLQVGIVRVTWSLEILGNEW